MLERFGPSATLGSRASFVVYIESNALVLIRLS